MFHGNAYLKQAFGGSIWEGEYSVFFKIGIGS